MSRVNPRLLDPCEGSGNWLQGSPSLDIDLEEAEVDATGLIFPHRPKPEPLNPEPETLNPWAWDSGGVYKQHLGARRLRDLEGCISRHHRRGPF